MVYLRQTQRTLDQQLDGTVCANHHEAACPDHVARNQDRKIYNTRELREYHLTFNVQHVPVFFRSTERHQQRVVPLPLLLKSPVANVFAADLRDIYVAWHREAYFVHRALHNPVAEDRVQPHCTHARIGYRVRTTFHHRFSRQLLDLRLPADLEFVCQP